MGPEAARRTLQRAEWSVKPDEPMGPDTARRIHLGMLGMTTDPLVSIVITGSAGSSKSVLLSILG